MKKGFTLVELLATIVIVTIISLIIFPLVSKQISGSKEDLYKVQVESIIKAAKEKALDEDGFLERAKYSTVYVTVEELQNTKNTEGKAYLESETIKNPMDDTIMNGFVKITYDESSNSYVYEYDNDLANMETVVETSAAEYILSKQSTIYTNEAMDGLFEDAETNTYYFKGNNPANFLKIGNTVWTIISINKETNEIKIAKTGHTTKGIWSSSSLSNYKFTNNQIDMYKYLNTTFSNLLTENEKKQMSSNATWNVGEVSNTSQTLKQVKAEEATLEVQSMIGLLSVSDYAYATYDLSCRKDFKKCYLNNYLVMSDKEYYLINTVKGEESVWTVSSSGLTKKAVTRELIIIPTVILKASSTITTGSGTSTDPYILEI